MNLQGKLYMLSMHLASCILNLSSTLKYILVVTYNTVIIHLMTILFLQFNSGVMLLTSTLDLCVMLGYVLTMFLIIYYLNTQRNLLTVIKAMYTYIHTISCMQNGIKYKYISLQNNLLNCITLWVSQSLFCGIYIL